jgi:hypothetical protein
MPENETETRSSQLPEFVEVPFPNFYTNGINIQFSNFEVVLFATERLDRTTATIKARIVMTHAHAKLLHQKLGEQIAKHEEIWGEIMIPIRDPKESDSSSTEPEPASAGPGGPPADVSSGENQARPSGRSAGRLGSGDSHRARSRKR